MHLGAPRLLTLALILTGCPKPVEETGETAPPGETDSPDAVVPSHVVLAWPVRGMNPMDASYETASLRPPGVSLRAQVVRRGVTPALAPTEGLGLSYAPDDATTTAGTTDFWFHAGALLGDDAPSIALGLTGLAIEGEFSGEGTLFEANGVPVVPTEGVGETGPFPHMALTLKDAEGVSLVEGLVLAPSSWDLGCGACHGDDWTADVLARHDARHGGTLSAETPVRCGACHAQPELGWAGDGETDGLAPAMHRAHAGRMKQLQGLEPSCLACHPGPDTPFHRGKHADGHHSCEDCHGSMEALVVEGRTPWQDLPRCLDCHQKPDVEYEQEGLGFSDSVGHGGLSCPACHHAAHGLYPSTLDADNAQNIELQGYAGVVSTCVVCHDPAPSVLFPHASGG